MSKPRALRGAKLPSFHGLMRSRMWDIVNLEIKLMDLFYPDQQEDHMETFHARINTNSKSENSGKIKTPLINHYKLNKP